MALFDDLARCSEAVSATTKRAEKVALLAGVLASVRESELAAAVSFLTGDTQLGRVGVGWATITDLRLAPVHEPQLSISEVATAFEVLADTAGSGSVAARRAQLGALLARATGSEQRLIVSILAGDLRQGALAGLLSAAVARAANVPEAALRRAAMLSGSLAVAATVARRDGPAGLAALQLTPHIPVLPMLASPAADVAGALAQTGMASVEWKLDGARVQAHRRNGSVALYTRNLNDVTARLPGVVALVASLPGGDLVLDGEVLGVTEHGLPGRFQDTMADFGTELVAGAGSGRSGGGLGAYFFDAMVLDGDPLIDEPLSERRARLVEFVPSAARPASIVTADPTEASAFLEAAVAAGHEGVMVKALGSRYEAGRRGGAWRKVKPVHTLDLVVLALEWGHGRRQGWLSNLHLGARGPDGTFVMVGKTFKGLTDETLRWQTERFLELAIARDPHVVHVRPEVVVEVALDGVQRSTRYPGGVALRFARVRRYRHDKAAVDADTIETVAALDGLGAP